MKRWDEKESRASQGMSVKNSRKENSEEECELKEKLKRKENSMSKGRWWPLIPFFDYTVQAHLCAIVPDTLSHFWYLLGRSSKNTVVVDEAQTFHRSFLYLCSSWNDITADEEVVEVVEPNRAMLELCTGKGALVSMPWEWNKWPLVTIRQITAVVKPHMRNIEVLKNISTPSTRSILLYLWLLSIHEWERTELRYRHCT